MPAGILWSRRTQDISSNITGSSVFDFEDDGKAEVVYADEVFVRVYDGTSGKVLFSQFRSSCTWYENPSSPTRTGTSRRSGDAVQPGVLCDGLRHRLQRAADQCRRCRRHLRGFGLPRQLRLPERQVRSGLLSLHVHGQVLLRRYRPGVHRCGLPSALPLRLARPARTACPRRPPQGRAGHSCVPDATDRWVRSRTIWNQHAYAVTHISEDSTVPETSAWKKNWLDPTLNNFRQNVPGDASGLGHSGHDHGHRGFQLRLGRRALVRAGLQPWLPRPSASGSRWGSHDGSTKVCETHQRPRLYRSWRVRDRDLPLGHAAPSTPKDVQ
ncbi:MAG: hypothetical protein U0263_22235 [Polyangiaceae bacterium]